MHGLDHAPLLDNKQDWILTGAEENVTHTTHSFHRLLNTWNDDDYAIIAT